MKTISATKSAQFVNVTPALAAKWLENNTDNRKQRGSYISEIANAMRRGEWQTTHQGIAFAKCGKLLDGQHRLEGIVRANLNLEMLVVTGLSPTTFSTIDVGAKRTLADTTNLSKKTAEACRILTKMVVGGVPTSAQVRQVADSGVEDVHERLMNYCGSTRSFYSSAAMRAAAVTLILNGASQEAVFKNYSNLVLENFNNMNSVSQCLVRMVNAKKVHAQTASPTYSYGLKVLNPDNGGMMRLSQTQEDISTALAFGKVVISRHIAI